MKRKYVILRVLYVEISVLLVCVYFCCFLLGMKRMEERENAEYSYADQKSFSMYNTTEKDFETLKNEIEAYSGMLLIAEMLSLYVNEDGAEHLCRMVMSQPQALHYNYAELCLDNIGEKEQVAIIGISCRYMTYKKGDNEYINICDETYRVIGYCKGKNTTVTNYSVIIFYDHVGPKTLQRIISAGNTNSVLFSINSDEIISESDLLHLQHNITKKGIEIDKISNYYNIFDGTNYKNLYIQIDFFFLICIGFGFLLLVEYWLVRRNEEFRIRRIFGYSKRQILGLIIKEFSIVYIMASGTSFIFILLFGYLYQGIFCVEFNSEISLYVCILIVLYLLLCGLCAVKLIKLFGSKAIRLQERNIL